MQNAVAKVLRDAESRLPGQGANLARKESRMRGNPNPFPDSSALLPDRASHHGREGLGAMLARRGTTLHLKTGERLDLGGDSSQIMAVLRGRARLFQSDSSGRLRFAGVAQEGGIVGLGAPNEGFDPPEFWAEADGPCEVVLVGSGQLQDIAWESPSAAVEILRLLTLELGRARRQIWSLSSRDGSARLASFLIDRAAESTESEAFRLDYSRAEIAGQIGVSTETAIRLPGKLSRNGIISLSGRRVCILDPKALARVALRTPS
jgi:CRP-like cAMP-binding protein